MKTDSPIEKPRTGFWQGWRNEPVRLILWLTALIQAVVAFGWLDLTEDQIEAAIALIGLTLGGAEASRSQAWPKNKVEKIVDRLKIVDRRRLSDYDGRPKR